MKQLSPEIPKSSAAPKTGNLLLESFWQEKTKSYKVITPMLNSSCLIAAQPSKTNCKKCILKKSLEAAVEFNGVIHSIKDISSRRLLQAEAAADSCGEEPAGCHGEQRCGTVTVFSYHPMRFHVLKQEARKRQTWTQVVPPVPPSVSPHGH